MQVCASSLLFFHLANCFCSDSAQFCWTSMSKSKYPIFPNQIFNSISKSKLLLALCTGGKVNKIEEEDFAEETAARRANRHGGNEIRNIACTI